MGDMQAKSCIVLYFMIRDSTKAPALAAFEHSFKRFYVTSSQTVMHPRVATSILHSLIVLPLLPLARQSSLGWEAIVRIVFS